MISSLFAFSQQCGKNLLTKHVTTQLGLSVEHYRKLIAHSAVQDYCCLRCFGSHTSKPSSCLPLPDHSSTIPGPHLKRPTWHLRSLQPMKLFPDTRRPFHKNSNNYQEPKRRPVPKLLYIQNPMTWLANKFDFRMLRRAWDHEFDEWEFKKGTKQAVSMITTMVSENCFKSLRGFLTKPAIMALQRDVETSWTDQQRRNIALLPEDIQLAVPRRIHFQRIVEQKFCDIDMVFIGLKWADTGTTSVVVFIEIIARFHREYTEGRLPDWTVSVFKVTRFNVLPK